MNQIKWDYDVVIVGGGIVGTACAGLLARGNGDLKIAVIESQKKMPNSQQWEGFDCRVSAITILNQQLFEQLGIWARMQNQHRVSSYGEMQVWDGEGTGSIHFSAADLHEPELGYIIENRVMTESLGQLLDKQSNVDVFFEDSVQSYELLKKNQERSVEAYSRIILSSGRQLVSRLLVAADGANSVMRKTAGLTTREWDYHHKAIVATVKTEQVHQQTAWQRFMPSGPLAFLPLLDKGQPAAPSHHYSSIVWSTEPQEAEQLMQLDDEQFMKRLGEAFEWRLGKILWVDKRHCFPLRQRHAKDYIKPGFVLVGDAAHTIHPLAGQGVNLGLQDARVLAQEVLQAVEKSIAIGSVHVLERYQRRRKTQNLAMMTMMEGFKRLFELKSLPVRWLRNKGLNAVDRAAWFKKQIIRRASGLE